MRTGTRGAGRCVVVGGWVSGWLVAAGAAAAGCAGHSGAREGARPEAGPEAVAIGAAQRLRDSVRARGRYVGGAGDSVPVGYGSVSRRRMTGSVASVSGDDGRSARVLRVEELLYRVPGVQVVSRGNGQYSIVVRGRNSLGYGSEDPLFVFDGLPVENGMAAFHALAPEDVERIDVIKDAEAAIYGARSANGVILVRTRHAKVSRD